MKRWRLTGPCGFKRNPPESLTRSRDERGSLPGLQLGTEALATKTHLSIPTLTDENIMLSYLTEKKNKPKQNTGAAH